MVKSLEQEETEPVERGTLKWILSVTIMSYCGYLSIGLWCRHIEFEDESKEDQGLRSLALALIIVSICRLGILGIFFFETDDNKHFLSTIWLTFSTLFMMIIYLVTCVEIQMFYHANVVVPPSLFVFIALDFVGNVMVICRKTAFQQK